MKQYDTKTGVIILLAGAFVAVSIIAYQAIEIVNLFSSIN